jgi:hypothetical protein
LSESWWQPEQAAAAAAAWAWLTRWLGSQAWGRGQAAGSGESGPGLGTRDSGPERRASLRLAVCSGRGRAAANNLNLIWKKNVLLIHGRTDNPQFLPSWCRPNHDLPQFSSGSSMISVKFIRQISSWRPWPPLLLAMHYDPCLSGSDDGILIRVQSSVSFRLNFRA